MELTLSPREFRRLLDLSYLGNWVLNSYRENARFQDYDALLSKLFSRFPSLSQTVNGITLPSKEYVEGGIHQAISCYEDSVFYALLAEELARRDLDCQEITEENCAQMEQCIQSYMAEFSQFGVDRLYVEEESS